MIARHMDKILITLGLLLLGLGLYWHFEAELRQKQLLADYLLLIEGLERLEHEPVDAEPDGQTDGTVTEPPQEPEAVPPGAMGILIIPAIDLKVAIKEGVSQAILNYAVGHFPETALPGETGNFALIGHRNYARGQFFNRLAEVKTGDMVTVKYGLKDYTYVIDESFVVSPDQISVLDGREQAEITLITCAPARKASHRLTVKGHLLATAHKKCQFTVMSGARGCRIE